MLLRWNHWLSERMRLPCLEQPIRFQMSFYWGRLGNKSKQVIDVDHTGPWDEAEEEGSPSKRVSLAITDAIWSPCTFGAFQKSYSATCFDMRFTFVSIFCVSLWINGLNCIALDRCALLLFFVEELNPSPLCLASSTTLQRWHKQMGPRHNRPAIVYNAHICGKVVQVFRA